MAPNFDMERQLMARGFPVVAGVDEVGRGPLAGPVCAAAVILDPKAIPDGLQDSKILSFKKRTALDQIIRDHAKFGIGWASVEEIDDINILRASHVAMVRAIEALPVRPDFVLIDGNMIPRGLNIPCQPVVKGDALSVSISAASIVAKNGRDLVMGDLAQHFPPYGWETNMGYPTAAHKKALLDFGVTPHHRRSFKPVHNILYQDKNLKP